MKLCLHSASALLSPRISAIYVFGATSRSSYSTRLSQTARGHGPVQSGSHSGVEKSFSLQGSDPGIVSGSAARGPTGEERSISTLRLDRRAVLSRLIGKSGGGLRRRGRALPAQGFHRG